MAVGAAQLSGLRMGVEGRAIVGSGTSIVWGTTVEDIGGDAMAAGADVGADAGVETSGTAMTTPPFEPCPNPGPGIVPYWLATSVNSGR